MLPPQGESLLSLAQQLGLRVFNRHTVQRKLSSQVQALRQRYYRYLQLLASDTQVRPGTVGGCPRVGRRGCISRWRNRGLGRWSPAHCPPQWGSRLCPQALPPPLPLSSRPGGGWGWSALGLSPGP